MPGVKAKEVLEVLDGPTGIGSLLDNRLPKGPRLLAPTKRERYHP